MGLSYNTASVEAKGRIFTRTMEDDTPRAGERTEARTALVARGWKPPEKEEESDGPRQPLSEQHALIVALYDELSRELYRYVSGMRLGREHTKEIIQETFLRLSMQMTKDDEIENIRGWIIRVAHNLAVDMRRKMNQQWKDAEEELQAMEAMAERSDPSPDPEEVYLKEEQLQRMKMALETFKPKHRYCFEMRTQGFRYKDIAEALGMSEQRVALVVKNVTIRLAAICG
jgi:RNA polymerase sigma-70 factor (ECF subfamily)